ncbi:hypothetical protein ABET51_06665 [Metabacillus fastidiosus]|uniref:hypothetical protein n=1 Tax=Metabacillus fastidiosus TaxID=1458 RepID=UPI003D290B6E
MKNRKQRYIPLEKRIVEISDVLESYLNELNIKSDPYMAGMANGLELALSIMEQRSPYYINPPNIFKYWLHKFKYFFVKLRMKIVR